MPTGPYGIDAALWRMLPPEDQIAIAAAGTSAPTPPSGAAPTALPVGTPASPAPPPNLSSGTTSRTNGTGDYPAAQTVTTPVKPAVTPPNPGTGWTLASRKAQVGRAGDATATTFDGYEDDVLVLPGPRRPAYPGFTLLAAPTAAPTRPPSAPVATVPPIPTPAQPAQDASEGDVLVLPGARPPRLYGTSGVRAPQALPSASGAVLALLSTDQPPIPVPAAPGKQPTKPPPRTSVGSSKRIAVPVQAATLAGLKLSVSLQADAALTWSLGGRSKVAVSFIDGRISMADGPLTVTDPGHLGRAASGFEHPSVLSFLDSLRQSRTTMPLVRPGERLPTVDLQISGKRVPVPLARDVEISQHLKEEHGHPTYEVTVTTGFNRNVPGYGDVKGEFSITARAELEQESKKHSRSRAPADLEKLAEAAIAVLIGLAVAQRVVPPILRPGGS